MVSSALLALLLTAGSNVEVSSEPEISSHGIGAVIAPAVMPRGSTALYALVGAPDIGGGFRQGFSMFELEVKLNFNYLLAAGLLEGGFRFSAIKREKFEIAPTVGLGLAADSGSRYYDRANFAYVALRPRVGGVAAIFFSETVTGLVTLDVPWAIPLTNHSAGGQLTPLLGAGAEMHLGGILSGLLLGQVGVDVIKEPLGVTQVRPAWAVRLGLGFRLF